MNIWYSLLKCIMRVYLIFFMRNPIVYGQENFIPGPKILIANHPNVTDSFILPFLLPEKLHFLIQANIFSLPVIGFLLRKSGQIPVVKGQGKVALDTALENLSLGKAIVIFPEGKLNHGGKLNRAGSGAAVLAKRSGVPIFPIGFHVPQSDTLTLKAKVHKRHTFGHFQVCGRCYIYIGEPWAELKSSDETIPHTELREITNRMMAQIGDLVQKAKYQAEINSRIPNYKVQLPKPTYNQQR